MPAVRGSPCRGSTSVSSFQAAHTDAQGVRVTACPAQRGRPAHASVKMKLQAQGSSCHRATGALQLLRHRGSFPSSSAASAPLPGQPPLAGDVQPLAVQRAPGLRQLGLQLCLHSASAAQVAGGGRRVAFSSPPSSPTDTKMVSW